MKFYNTKKTNSPLNSIIILLAILMSVTAWAQSENTVGVVVNADPHPGYNLFAAFRGVGTYLIDNDGNLINSWEDVDMYSPGGAVYLLKNGHLLYTCYDDNPFYTAGGRGGTIREYDWDGNLVWEFQHSSPTFRQHHDVLQLPNGNFLILAWEFKSVEEAEEAGRVPGTITVNQRQQPHGLWPEHMFELKPDYKTGVGGDIKWEWHLWDHLVQDVDPTKENYAADGAAAHPELININFPPQTSPDWQHANSLDYNPELDQILISCNNWSEFWVIDHSTTTEQAAGHKGGKSKKGGDILYRWGNPQSYLGPDYAGYRNDYNQHRAVWVKSHEFGYHHNDNGTIMFFNNNGGDKFDPLNNFSTIDEITPPIDKKGRYILDGEMFGPMDLTWTFYDETLWSTFISGAQRLPNGNTLICYGATGTFIEVTPMGDVVWKYVSPVENYSPAVPGPKDFGDTFLHYDQSPTPVSGLNPDWGATSNFSFRVTRYSPDFKGFRGKDLTPGDPLELYSDLAKISGDYMVLDQVNLPDKYFLSQNYPNPFNPETKIEFQLPEASNVELKIYNTLGEEVRTLTEKNFEAGYHGVVWNGLDNAQQFVPSGVYIYQIRAGNFTQVKKMMLLK